MHGFIAVQQYTIFMLESIRLSLQNIEVDLSFPEPLGRTELNIFRIDPCNPTQHFEKPLAGATVLDTKRNIGDPLHDPINGGCFRQGFQVINLFPAGI